MVDLLVTLNQLFGSAVVTRLKALRDERKANASDRRRQEEAQYVSPSAMVEVVSEFYGREKTAQAPRRYVVNCSGRRIPTTIYIQPEHLHVKRPALHISHNLHSVESTFKQSQALADYAAKVADRLELLGVQLWDDPLYRILGCGPGGTAGFSFTEVNFTTWRFSSGLLPDELADALIAARGDASAVLADCNAALPLRAKILAHTADLFDFRSRLCCGGLGLVVALARPTPDNDFIIPIQVRSSTVSDSRGLLAVIPKAFHQAAVGDPWEVNIHWSAMREVFEELYGGQEVRRHDETRLRHDWYLGEHEPMRYFRNHQDDTGIELLSFGVNALGGNFENALLLPVTDASYWQRYGDAIKANWEAKRFIRISTRATNRIEQLLTEGRWAPESVFHITQALIRLAELAPERVALPRLAVELE